MKDALSSSETSVLTRATPFFIVTAVKSSNLTYLYQWYEGSVPHGRYQTDYGAVSVSVFTPPPVGSSQFSERTAELHRALFMRVGRYASTGSYRAESRPTSQKLNEMARTTKFDRVTAVRVLLRRSRGRLRCVCSGRGCVPANLIPLLHYPEIDLELIELIVPVIRTEDQRKAEARLRIIFP
jgi:hypothetical protein